MHVAKTRAVAGTMDGASLRKLRKLRKDTYEATWIKYPDREKIIVERNKDYFETVKAYLVDWKYMGEPVVNEGTFKYCALYADNEEWQAFIMRLRELYDNVPNEDKNTNNLFAIDKLAGMRVDYQKKVSAAKQKKKQGTKRKPPESSTGAPQKHPFRLGSATVQSPPTAGGGGAAPTMDQSAVPRQNNATAQSGFLPPKPDTRKKAKYPGDAAPGGSAAAVSLGTNPHFFPKTNSLNAEPAAAGGSWSSRKYSGANPSGTGTSVKPTVWARTRGPGQATPGTSGTGTHVHSQSQARPVHTGGPNPADLHASATGPGFISAAGTNPPARLPGPPHAGTQGHREFHPAGAPNYYPPPPLADDGVRRAGVLPPRANDGVPHASVLPQRADGNGTGYYPSRSYDPLAERERAEHSKKKPSPFFRGHASFAPPPPDTSPYHREQMLKRVAKLEGDYYHIYDYCIRHNETPANAIRFAKERMWQKKLAEQAERPYLKNPKLETWAKNRLDSLAAAKEAGYAPAMDVLKAALDTMKPVEEEAGYAAETAVSAAAAAELAAEKSVEAAMSNLTL